MIMKVAYNETPFTVKKISPLAGFELGTTRSVGHAERNNESS